MTAIGRTGHLDPRLHHPDGTHRSTARTANGSELESFERSMRAHLAAHEERPDDRFRVEWKYLDGAPGDEPNEFFSGATYTLKEAEARANQLRDEDCFDILIYLDRES